MCFESIWSRFIPHQTTSQEAWQERNFRHSDLLYVRETPTEVGRTGKDCSAQGPPLFFSVPAYKARSICKLGQVLEQMCVYSVHGRCPVWELLCSILLWKSRLKMFGCSTENGKHVRGTAELCIMPSGQTMPTEMPFLASRDAAVV